MKEALVKVMPTARGRVLVPVDAEGIKDLESLKIDKVYRVQVKQDRSTPYHRRFFALLQLGFDMWTETIRAEQALRYRGEEVLPDFERFRSDVIVLAGFYNPVYGVNGDVRLEPKSIAYRNMDQDSFERLYSAVVNVFLKKFSAFAGWDRARIDSVINQIMELS